MAADDVASWGDLVTKMKEGLMATFEEFVHAREEEIRKSEETMSIPGWNFCTYFILKVAAPLLLPPNDSKD